MNKPHNEWPKQVIKPVQANDFFVILQAEPPDWRKASTSTGP
jgi:hypothetical protein